MLTKCSTTKNRTTTKKSTAAEPGVHSSKLFRCRANVVTMVAACLLAHLARHRQRRSIVTAVDYVALTRTHTHARMPTHAYASGWHIKNIWCVHVAFACACACNMKSAIVLPIAGPTAGVRKRGFISCHATFEVEPDWIQDKIINIFYPSMFEQTLFCEVSTTTAGALFSLQRPVGKNILIAFFF